MKPSLAVAYHVMRKNRKKMASGGEVANEDLNPMSEPGLDSAPVMGVIEIPHGMAAGGMAHPSKIAHMIMIKKMAAGGMADDCGYALGGQVEGDSDPELASTDSDDSVPIPELGYDSEREDTEGMEEPSVSGEGHSRKGTLLRIMRDLHKYHKGG